MDQKGSTMNIDLRSPALNWINGEWVDSAQLLKLQREQVQQPPHFTTTIFKAVKMRN